MEAECMTVNSAQPAKFSRYRSVRKSVSHGGETPLSAQIPNVPVPALPTASQQDAPLTRGPSRYRRPGIAKHHVPMVPLPELKQTSVPETVTAQASPQQCKIEIAVAPATVTATAPANPEFIRSTARAVQSPKNVFVRPFPSSPKAIQAQPPFATTSDQQSTAMPTASRYRSRTVSKPQDKETSKRRSYDHAREEARMILEGEHDRLAKLKQQQEIAERERRKRAEAKAAAERAAQREKDQEERARRQVQEEKAVEQQRSRSRSRKWTIGQATVSDHRSPSSSTPQSPQASVRPSHDPKSRAQSSDGRRHREASAEQDESVSSPDKRPSLKQRIRRPTFSRPKEKEPPVPKAVFEPKAGDGPPKSAVNGPAPLDAPVSAVNAGERRVEVRFEDFKITLPVTPTTTVKDLLNSASIIMSQPIDPRTAVIVETYYPLGLERSLRKYEHIRDVMNSWDSDTQNYLMIIPGDQISSEGLELKEAPAEQPHKTMFQLHHSRKPGKWEKHWMTIRTDGQVTASSKENDVDATNVFHLSDFDIYLPTKKQMKRLRPPKKFAFAIKSQQRSIVFESTENFVHFFSTNDKTIADQWYRAVQAWRSWYLVDILGQGTGAKPVTSCAPAAILASTARPSTSHSRDSIPYQLGAFEPLLDFSVDAFKYGEESQQKTTSPPRSQKATHNRLKSNSDPKSRSVERHATQRRQAPTAYPNHSQKPSQASIKIPSATDAAFTGKGLLARQYSIKKAQAEENVAFLQDTDNAFTGGLLGRQRSTRKAPENAVPVVFEDTSAGFTNSGLLSRVRSVKRAPDEAFIPENSNDAFTGMGLLGVQRAITKKKSSQRANGQPLVDLSGSSNFANGSLLQQVEGYEASMGMNGPTIDRSRGLEINAKTGEM